MHDENYSYKFLEEISGKLKNSSLLLEEILKSVNLLAKYDPLHILNNLAYIKDEN